MSTSGPTIDGRPYRQVFLPEDQARDFGAYHPADGWPLHWLSVPSLPLAAFEMDPDQLAARLGISFEQRVDYGDDLGDMPRAILNLPSGLRIGFSLFYLRGHMPHWHSIMLDVASTTIKRPFVDGLFSEYIVERYRDDLIAEVETAIGLPADLISWRVPPFFDPPFWTPEGQAWLDALARRLPNPLLDSGAVVRAVPRWKQQAHLAGVVGTVVRRQRTRLRETPTPPVCGVLGPQFADMWERLAYYAQSWTYFVAFRDRGSIWHLREDELTPTGEIDPNLEELQFR
jgi:hypothetical protein